MPAKKGKWWHQKEGKSVPNKGENVKDRYFSVTMGR